MTLRIVMGAAGTGKTTLVLDEVAKILDDQPLGKPLVIITPEQATFLTEFQLASHLLVGGSLRAEVLSFASLYKRLAKELRTKKLPWLDNQGKTMLITDILGKRGGELKVLNKIAHYQSTADDVLKLIDEFDEYQINPEMLLLAAEKVGNPLTKAKLEDLAMIQSDLLEKTNKAYLDEGKIMAELVVMMEKSKIYGGAEFWFDGFVEFTPVQLNVVETIIKCSKKVTITLPLTSENEDVFAKSIKTKNKLALLAKSNNIPLVFDELLKNYRQKDAADLLLIEESFRKEKFVASQIAPENITLMCSQNPQEEVENAAQIIIKMCKEGYEFKDFSIITRSLMDYSSIIEKTFDDYKISYYLDKSTDLQSHPVVNLLLSALDVVGDNWSSSAVMTYLKSGLAPVSMSKVDILENYALKFGVKGKMWQHPERWVRGGKIDFVKKSAGIAIAPLLDLDEKLHKPEVNTYKDYTNSLREFMQSLKVEKKLELWQDDAISHVNLEIAQGHAQILSQLNKVFEQLEEFLGNEECTTHKFKELFAASTKCMNINTVPLAMDQVAIAEISRSRLAEIKIGIVLGMNDGEFPAAIVEDGLFGSIERDELAKVGLDMAQSQRSEQFTENHHIYTAMTRPTEKLIVSYHKNDFEKIKTASSVVVSNLKTIFTALEEVADNNKYMHLAGDKSTITKISKHLLKISENASVVDDEIGFWQNVYSDLSHKNSLNKDFNALEKSINCTVGQKQLPQAILEQLYKKMHTTSVSRIETFNSCPMKYYANYGLNMRPREEFALRVMDIGSLYHYVLAEIIKDLTLENCIWEDLKAADIEPRVLVKIDEFAARGMIDLFKDSGKNEYAKSKILGIIVQNVLDMAGILALGDFKPVAFELDFGMDYNMHNIPTSANDKDSSSDLASLKIPLTGDKNIELRGQIDRVDMALGTQRNYVRIIDYKMRNKTLALGDVYYGINWQMPLYMEALLQGYNGKLKGDVTKKISPAGMFYVPVQDFVDGGLENDEFSGLKLQGLAILDKEALLLAEREFADGYKSKTMQVQLKKDGTFSKLSQGLTAEQYKSMNNFITKEVEKRFNDMCEGVISQKPLHNGTYSSCEFCDYYGICATDLAVEKNEVMAHKMSIDEFFELIKIDEDNKNTHNSNNIVVMADEKGGGL